VYLPPNTQFEYKFIRKDTNGNVRYSLARAHFLVISLTMLALNRVSLTDRVGIGSEQAGHDACIRSAVDSDDELALIGTMIIPS